MRSTFSVSLLGAGLLLAGCYRHSHAPSGGGSAEDAPLPELVSIPEGSFTMGDMNGQPSEYPEREVRVPAFRIDRTEVSNAAYGACVDAGGCERQLYADDPELGAADRPVVGVSWLDARAFCTWAGRRLPTEMEWERAARGGDLRKWPWGPVFNPAYTNTRSDAEDWERTAPVGSFPEGASPFGVLDMAGNAAEWVADYFDPTIYRSDPRAELTEGPLDGRERSVRGGSWADGPHRVRVASRQGQSPTEVDDGTGFRCAR